MSHYVLLLVVSAVSCFIPQAEAKCPAFFEQYNLACYYYGNNHVATVQDALRTCYSLGGYLLNINADLENTHVIGKLKQQPTIFDGYWIGGFFNGQQWVWQKKDASGNVVNIYMSPEEAQYKNWGPHQPNAIGHIYSPYTAIMTRHRPAPYMWYSENGYIRMPGGMSYVCEADWKPEI